MKKYNVTVNGKIYTVEVEETDAAYQSPISAAPSVGTSSPAKTPPAAATAPSTTSSVVEASSPNTPAPEIKEEKAEAGKVGKTEVKSPMAGTILRSLVSVGEKIEKNQGILILEAMKMENEIVAPVAGVVATINIPNGASVKTGDLLLSID